MNQNYNNIGYYFFMYLPLPLYYFIMLCVLFVWTWRTSSAFLVEQGSNGNDSLSFCSSGKVIFSFIFEGHLYVAFLVDSFFFFLSALWIYPPTPFWPPEFLLRNWLIMLWNFPCMQWVTFVLLLLRFFVFDF